MMNETKIIASNYGSIPHLSTSKKDQKADKKITSGQEEILTKKARDWRDLIIVTEKLDGSNVGIVKKDGELHAISRSGHTAISSPYKQHHYFDEWVKGRESQFSFLPEGWRICGEWMVKTHGTRYNIIGMIPFVAFDIINDNGHKLDYMTFIKVCTDQYIDTVPLIHIGQPVSIENSLKLLGPGRWGRSIDDAEGVVYRCERNGEVDFMAKHVRSGKIDGKFMKSDLYNEGWSHE